MVSRYFESMPYRLNEETGHIDYDEMERSALLFRPKLIVAGASAYSRLIDYERIRQIADKVGAYVMAGKLRPINANFSFGAGIVFSFAISRHGAHLRPGRS